MDFDRLFFRFVVTLTLILIVYSMLLTIGVYTAIVQYVPL